MSFINIALSSIGSIIALFLLSKLIGNKQMSQLNMFDYINGITIGSIAAEMATSLETDFLKPLLAMMIYALAAVLYSYINEKSLKSRRVLMGRSVILLSGGKLYCDGLKRAHLDLSEFLIQCRQNGFFDLAEIEMAVFEPNGAISFLPKSDKRPVNNEDLKLKPQPAEPCVNVIVSGKIMEENLKHLGKTPGWLLSQLKNKKINDIKDVFLATLTESNRLEIFKKHEISNKNDIFQ